MRLIRLVETKRSLTSGPPELVRDGGGEMSADLGNVGEADDRASWRCDPGDGSGRAESLAPGAKAPAFTREGSDGKTYTLSQFVGRRGVVLAWFPRTFTPG